MGDRLSRGILSVLSEVQDRIDLLLDDIAEYQFDATMFQFRDFIKPALP